MGFAPVDGIARLGRVHYGAVELADFGRTEGYLERQVGGWRKQLSGALFDKVVALNFKGPFRLAALIGQRMAAGGSIINISSGASWKAMPWVVPYAVAKAAPNAMTIGLAQEYGPKVRVNAIAAGPFLTDIAKA